MNQSFIVSGSWDSSVRIWSRYNIDAHRIVIEDLQVFYGHRIVIVDFQIHYRSGFVIWYELELSFLCGSWDISVRIEFRYNIYGHRIVIADIQVLHRSGLVLLNLIKVKHIAILKLIFADQSNLFRKKNVWLMSSKKINSFYN